MDKRSAMEPSSRDDIIRTSKYETRLVVVDAPYIERDDRKIRGIIVERDARNTFEFPDKVCREFPSFPLNLLKTHRIDKPKSRID
jgi:hypothetical protein